ncbi:MAG: alpha-galactosidase [Victivallales bacterium]|nr:alpha-galactosidase [Victivallales bacterium]
MITFIPETKTFHLNAGDISYLFCIDDDGALVHLYFGPHLESADLRPLQDYRCLAFSPYHGEALSTHSPDVLMQEFPSHGVGDYSPSAVIVRNAQGNDITSLHYVSHTIEPGKSALPGLPATFATDDEAETLAILLSDDLIGLEVTLSYTVFRDLSIIARSATATNRGSAALTLEKLASLSVDFTEGPLDLCSFPGAHARERQFQRERLHFGRRVCESLRGYSSHQMNPAVILCDPAATETAGRAYGALLVYSGNFAAEVDVSQIQRTRLTLGIHPQTFRWHLAPGETFQAPEALIGCSDQGFARLTHAFHDLMRKHLLPPKWVNTPRPILVNSWEAMFFNFNREKLLALGKTAAEHGVEMLVLDDGWFGHRDDDTTSLGDWTVNTAKLGGTMAQLSDDIHALGLKFGLWFEPEMVSEDSDLFRAHPDWALQVSGRTHSLGRHQMVLDLSRPEVVDHLYHAIESVVASARIEYIKWDANRHLTEVASATLPPERQGEVFHRYILGLYHLHDRLVKRFPEILFEGCSGGGGRFDAGMLYYCPQIWCSDNTNCIDRLAIQYGTSFFYPCSTMGAHVTVSDGLDFDTRFPVALAGTFGYELDLNLLPPEQLAKIPEQCKRFHELHHLVDQGDYYRLTSPMTDRVTAWMNVAKDKREFLLTSVVPIRDYAIYTRLRLPGLDPGLTYEDDAGNRYRGDVLMNHGFPLPPSYWSVKSFLWHFKAI